MDMDFHFLEVSAQEYCCFLATACVVFFFSINRWGEYTCDPEAWGVGQSDQEYKLMLS